MSEPTQAELDDLDRQEREAWAAWEREKHSGDESAAECLNRIHDIIVRRGRLLGLGGGAVRDLDTRPRGLPTREQVLREPPGKRLDRWVHRHVLFEKQKRVPAYSTDIAAAWTLLEHCLEYTGGFFCVTEKGWLCRFSDHESLRHEVEAETAPLAICRAALVEVVGLWDDEGAARTPCCPTSSS